MPCSAASSGRAVTAVVASACSARRSSASVSVSSGRFAHRTTAGSRGPRTSSVSTMTPAVTKMMSSRPENGSPLSKVPGTESARAREIAPRNPAFRGLVVQPVQIRLAPRRWPGPPDWLSRPSSAASDTSSAMRGTASAFTHRRDALADGDIGPAAHRWHLAAEFSAWLNAPRTECSRGISTRPPFLRYRFSILTRNDMEPMRASAT